MGKLGLRAEAAVARIELRDDRSGNLVHKGQVQRAPASGKALIVLNGGHHAAGRFQRFVAALAPHLRHRQQHASHSRPPVAVFAGNIRAAKVGPAVGSQKRGQRPAALPADRGNRGLVARIHIGALVAIHLHGHKMLVDERGDLGVLIRLAVHHVAPVAPHRADVQQDGLVLSLRTRKRRLAPRLPIAPADAAPSADTMKPSVRADCRRR